MPAILLAACSGIEGLSHRDYQAIKREVAVESMYLVEIDRCKSNDSSKADLREVLTLNNCYKVKTSSRWKHGSWSWDFYILTVDGGKVVIHDYNSVLIEA